MSLEVPTDAFAKASRRRIIGKLCASFGISENLDRLARVDKKTKIYIALGRFLEKIHEASDALGRAIRCIFQRESYYRKARRLLEFLKISTD